MVLFVLSTNNSTRYSKANLAGRALSILIDTKKSQMAESYQNKAEKATSECVPGIGPYISALENCKANYDKLEKKIEEYQKQQGEQINELSKEVQSLNEQKSQLKQKMEGIIMQLETKVRAITFNTEGIQSLKSELSKAIESFSKSKDDEKDILSRLVVLEEKITDKGKMKELEGEIEKLKRQNEKLEERIGNLENEVHHLRSHRVTKPEILQATGEDKTNKSRSIMSRLKEKGRSGVKRTQSVQNKPTAIKDESSSDDILADEPESPIKQKSSSREALDQL